MIKRCAVLKTVLTVKLQSNGWTIPCRAIGISKSIEGLTTMADECKPVE